MARSLGLDSIEAHVTEILTGVAAGRTLRLADLALKSSERLFREHVPLPPASSARVRLRNPRHYGVLAENVEAWAFRASQQREQFLDRLRRSTASGGR